MKQIIGYYRKIFDRIIVIDNRYGLSNCLEGHFKYQYLTPVATMQYVSAFGTSWQPWHFDKYNYQAPAYITDDRHLVAESGRRSLRSAERSICVIQRCNNTFGDRSSSSSSFSLLRTDKTQLATQTRLQSNSSQYMSLYSDRVIKFLSLRCPICSGSCLSWTRCLS